MGGDAAWILTDVMAPAAFPSDSGHTLYRHLEATVREFGLSIVVGDLSAGTDLEIPCHHPRHHPCGTAVLRSSARPGDALFFSGILESIFLFLAIAKGDLCSAGWGGMW